MVRSLPQAGGSAPWGRLTNQYPCVAYARWKLSSARRQGVASQTHGDRCASGEGGAFVEQDESNAGWRGVGRFDEHRLHEARVVGGEQFGAAHDSTGGAARGDEAARSVLARKRMSSAAWPSALRLSAVPEEASICSPRAEKTSATLCAWRPVVQADGDHVQGKSRSSTGPPDLGAALAASLEQVDFFGTENRRPVRCG